MSYRKITAHFIYPISSLPVKNGVIVIDSTGKIIEFFHQNEFHKDELEFYDGIICPGFVNTHCHLELSHLRSKIPQNTGIVGFIKKVNELRFADKSQIFDSIQLSEKEMIKNGIVAVGDISNSDYSFEQKSRTNLPYHTFIEAFGFNPQKADESLQKAKKLSAVYRQFFQNAETLSHVSITPHAPYSVSEELFLNIKKIFDKNGMILSVHNQESNAENDFFKDKKGDFIKLFDYFKLDISYWKPKGMSSLKSILNYFPANNKTLLVHNTFTSDDDIKSAHNSSDNIWWCFCPKANLYIENRLPDFSIFLRNNAKITLGTDSLASNNSLSILEEMKVIASSIPGIELSRLLTWGTANGAEYLGFSNYLGTLEKGKKPGLNYISNIDLLNLNLLPQSQVTKIA